MPLAMLAPYLLAVSRAINIATRSAEGGKGDEIFESFSPHFDATQLTPPQFLIVSSITERKIVYAQLKNFKSLTGRTYALIDSGLESPMGIAVDRDRGALYVADPGAGSIFRYRLVVQDADDPKDMKLNTDGTQVTILQDVSVKWVTVNVDGDVLYSDEGSNTIGKIPEATIALLAEGSYRAADLSFVSEKAMEASQASVLQQEMKMPVDAPPTDAPSIPLNVYTLYEGKVNPHVSVPGGIVSDGLNIYWTNRFNGTNVGSAVMGEVDPKLDGPVGNGSSELPAFPTVVLAKNTDEAFGIAKCSSVLLFSSNSSGVGRVYGLVEGSGSVFGIIPDLAEPRGLVWDGDQTVFVADMAANSVWSFACGRLIAGAPKTEAAVLTGAFGVALLSKKDKGWSFNKSDAHSLHGVKPGGGLLLFLLVWLVARAASP